jgi:hypothetical protein
MKFTVTFLGRKTGAIGKPVGYHEVVEAEGPEDAWEKLYELGYEHISNVTCFPHSNPED